MKNSAIILFVLLAIILMASFAWGQITYTSTAVGNWSTMTWSPSGTPGASDTVVIRDGDTVTIDQNVTIGGITVGQGTSGVLTFDTSAVRTIAISGNVMVSSGGTFIISSTSFTKTHTLTIGGNLINNGAFDMSLGRGSGVCNVTFNNASVDQLLSGTGSLTRFRGVTLNKGSVSNRVVSSINTIVNGSTLFKLTAGTWEQTAGTLQNMTGNDTIPTTGSLVISGSGSFKDTAATFGVRGNLTINTTGTVQVGNGSNGFIVFAGTATFNAGTIIVGGRLTLSGGTTTINGATITIDPWATTVLGTGSNTFECSGTANLTFSSGSVTLIDPNKNNISSRTGNDIRLSSTGSLNLLGGTLFLGDGISSSGGDTTMFYLSINAGITIGNLTLQTGGGTGRNSILKNELNVGGVLTLNSGKLDLRAKTLIINNPITGIATATSLVTGDTSSITIAGSTTGITIPSNVTVLKNLTINNTNGTTLQSNLTLVGTLTFTSGKLVTGANVLTLGSASAISGPGTSKFVEGNVSRTISGAGALTWPIGQDANYLPVTIYTTTVTTPGSITIQALDKSVKIPAGPISSTAKTLNRYYRTTGDENLSFVPDSISLSFAQADLQVGVFASNLEVVRWNSNPWIKLTTSAIDSSTNTIVVTGSNAGDGDWVIVGGPIGIYSPSTSAINYGIVLGGQTKVDSVIVTNTGTSSLVIDSVISSMSEFTIAPSSATITSGSAQTFIITYAPVSAGTKAGTIIFYHKGLSGQDSVGVTGGVILEAHFAAEPDTVDFGTVVKNVTKVDSIVVTNGGNDALVIDSVKSSASEFSISPTKITIAAGATEKFYISYTPTSGGAKSGVLLFYDNSTTKPDTVWVKGDVVIAPSFVAVPLVLEFGSVITGQNKVDSITVTNNGTAQLVISSVASTNDVFSISPTSATIGIDSSQVFYVTFTPSVAGMQDGKIGFNHNASTIDSITVSGKGVVFGSIKQARLSPVGTEVIFEGIATKVKGGFSYLQDTSAGIVMYQSSGVWRDSVNSGGIKVGDLIHVRGKTSEYASLLEISRLDLVSFSVISHDNPLPEPQLLTLKQIADGGENYEAELVKVVSVSIIPGADTVFSAAKTYNIKDPTDTTNAVTLRVPNAGDSDIDGRNILRLVTCTGVVGQFHYTEPAKGYQLMVIDSTDLEPLASFLMEPTILQFDSTSVGVSRVDSIAVTNNGSAQLVISSVVSSNPVFTVTPTNATINPGITQWFIVTFTPTAIGVQTDQIVFSHNALSASDTLAVSGTGKSPVGVDDLEAAIPKVYQLHNNYPNPFNPSTTILYDLPQQSKVVLKVYSLLGQEIATLVDGIIEAGYRQVIWSGKYDNGRQVASGIYIYRIFAEPMGEGKTFTQVKKMLMLK